MPNPISFGASEALVIDLLSEAGVSNIAVAGVGGTGFSLSMILPARRLFGLIVQCTSSGGIAVQVDIESSNVAPTTEGAADTTNYGVNDVPVISSIASNVNTPAAMGPVLTKYSRLKFTGLAGNHASTVISKLQLTISE